MSSAPPPPPLVFGSEDWCLLNALLKCPGESFEFAVHQYATMLLSILSTPPPKDDAQAVHKFTLASDAMVDLRVSVLPDVDDWCWERRADTAGCGKSEYALAVHCMTGFSVPNNFPYTAGEFFRLSGIELPPLPLPPLPPLPPPSLPPPSLPVVVEQENAGEESSDFLSSPPPGPLGSSPKPDSYEFVITNSEEEEAEDPCLAKIVSRLAKEFSVSFSPVASSSKIDRPEFLDSPIPKCPRSKKKRTLPSLLPPSPSPEIDRLELLDLPAPRRPFSEKRPPPPQPPPPESDRSELLDLPAPEHPLPKKRPLSPPPPEIDRSELLDLPAPERPPPKKRPLEIVTSWLESPQIPAWEKSPPMPPTPGTTASLELVKKNKEATYTKYQPNEQAQDRAQAQAQASSSQPSSPAAPATSLVVVLKMPNLRTLGPMWLNVGGRGRGHQRGRNRARGGVRGRPRNRNTSGGGGNKFVFDWA